MPASGKQTMIQRPLPIVALVARLPAVTYPPSTNSVSHSYAQALSRLCFERSFHRSWHRQYTDLPARSRDRPERAIGRRDPRRNRARRANRAGGWRSGEEHVGPDARKYHRDPPLEGRCYRRLHRHRENAPAFHKEGTRQPLLQAQPARSRLRDLWIYPG